MSIFAFPRTPLRGAHTCERKQNFRRAKSEWRSACSPGPPGPGFAKIAGATFPQPRLPLPRQRSRSILAGAPRGSLRKGAPWKSILWMPFCGQNAPQPSPARRAGEDGEQTALICQNIPRSPSCGPTGPHGRDSGGRSGRRRRSRRRAWSASHSGPPPWRRRSLPDRNTC